VAVFRHRAALILRSKFLVDASISRVSSASFFGDGTAHEGFMRELFPMGHGRSDDYGEFHLVL